MFKTIVAIFLALALCVNSIGCASSTPVVNRDISGSEQADEGKKPETSEPSMLLGAAVMFAVLIPAGIVMGVILGLEFKSAREN